MNISLMALAWHIKLMFAVYTGLGPPGLCAIYDASASQLSPSLAITTLLAPAVYLISLVFGGSCLLCCMYALQILYIEQAFEKNETRESSTEVQVDS